METEGNEGELKEEEGLSLIFKLYLSNIYLCILYTLRIGAGGEGEGEGVAVEVEKARERDCFVRTSKPKRGEGVGTETGTGTEAEAEGGGEEEGVAADVCESGMMSIVCTVYVSRTLHTVHGTSL